MWAPPSTALAPTVQECPLPLGKFLLIGTASVMVAKEGLEAAEVILAW